MTRFSDDEPYAGSDQVDAALQETRETLAELSDLSERFARTFTRSMTSAIRSGRSFGDTLRGLALSLSDIALKAGLKPLEALISRGIGSVVDAAAGAVVPFAKGGVVASPTYFTAGGKAGVMGEAGPEAILPLARGADGRLGIAAADGGGAAGGAINVTVNIATPDIAGFRKSEAQVSAQLARALSRAGRTL